MKSFLICFHDDRADVYENGLPLGVVRDGVFHIHANKMPDGTLVPVRIDERLAGEVDLVALRMNTALHS